jgi:hypothetical protein
VVAVGALPLGRSNSSGRGSPGAPRAQHRTMRR